MGNWSLITYYCAITMILIAYVLGSIPSAVWIGKKYYGVDIREHGSKNAGTTNMLRVLGRRAAVPVFVLDFFKGFVAVSIITLMRYDADVSSAWLINLKILGVFAAVLGHIFPVFGGMLFPVVRHSLLFGRMVALQRCVVRFHRLLVRRGGAAHLVSPQEYRASQGWNRVEDIYMA